MEPVLSAYRFLSLFKRYLLQVSRYISFGNLIICFNFKQQILWHRLSNFMLKKRMEVTETKDITKLADQTIH